MNEAYSEPIPMADERETSEKKDRLEGERLANRYLLEKLIDRGGFGGVYEGLDSRFDSRVAIKVLFPPFSDNEFRREAKLARRFQHPNVVEVYDYGIDGGLAFIVMEYLRGDRVDQLLRRFDRLFPLGLLDKFVFEITSALENAHEQALVHRDLKPQNVMLIDEGTPTERFKLLDFGIAAQTDATDTLRNATRDTAFTPSYGAPERFTGDEVDHRTDIYSLGTILFELVTGNLPFSEERLLMLMQAVQSKPPPPFSEVAPHVAGCDKLEALIMRCLAKEPAERPQSMKEMREEYFEARQTQIVDPLDRARFVDLWKRDANSSTTAELSFSAADTNAPTIDAPDTGDVTARTETSQSIDTDQGTFDEQLSAAQEELHQTVRSQHRRMWRNVAAAACLAAAAVFAAVTLLSPARAPSPPAPQVWLPPEFVPVAGDENQQFEVDGRLLYERIERTIEGRNTGDPAVRAVFLLIHDRFPHEDGKGDNLPRPSPFYIMENKVWNGLYRRFAEENKKRIDLDERDGKPIWQEGAMVGEGLLRADNPRLPAFNVSVADAHDCARWLGGRLPTVEEWNTAAGYYDWVATPEDRRERAGPFAGQWPPSGSARPDIAIAASDERADADEAAPAEVGDSQNDVSLFGCRDMAGNGLEWTCNMVDRNDLWPIANPSAHTEIVIRGKSYKDPEPFLFEDFAFEDGVGYDLPAPWIGFRIVVEIE